ncbi:hypothetical protein C6501_11365 [Candidatus Poribacteria bacterium]|nr:MAG: hypothetical protein C6501_11365 [Candidatus Poribacteria bacterium]
MRFTTFSLLVIVIMLIAPGAIALHDEDKGPEKFGSYEFKEQDIKAATDACDAPAGIAGPEFVPTVRDNQPNLALLKDAKPNASSLLGGWCPQRHCTEYLNDGFYNNCRSWIINAVPGWAQIDIGAVANVNRIYFGSDHAQNFLDRMTADFDILVATTKADANSEANTWTKVYTHKGAAISKTTEITFDDVEARWVRIHIRLNNDARIDEIEIYGGNDPMAVEPTAKLTTIWAQVKTDKF